MKPKNIKQPLTEDEIRTSSDNHRVLGGRTFKNRIFSFLNRWRKVHQRNDHSNRHIATTIDRLCLENDFVDVCADIRKLLKIYPGAREHLSQASQKLIVEIDLYDAEKELQSANKILARTVLQVGNQKRKK